MYLEAFHANHKCMYNPMKGQLNSDSETVTEDEDNDFVSLKKKEENDVN